MNAGKELPARLSELLDIKPRTDHRLSADHIFARLASEASLPAPLSSQLPFQSEDSSSSFLRFVLVVLLLFKFIHKRRLTHIYLLPEALFAQGAQSVQLGLE